MQGTRHFVGAWIVITISTAHASALAGDCCDHCGCRANVCKVCRAVPDVKEIKKTCWDVKCEDFCVPGCSKYCGTVDECDKCGPWSRTVWSPGCAKVYTRRLPVKTEVVRKIPTTKWVVETLCSECQHRCCATAPATTGQKLAAALTSKTPAEIPAPAHVAPQEPPVATTAKSAEKRSWLTNWMK